VEGTTGYDALREVCGLFVNPTGENPLTELAEELGVPTDLPDVERKCKLFVAERMLRAEVNRIAALLETSEVVGRDTDEEAVQDAVALLLACFTVYRSYLPEGRRALEVAVRDAITAFPRLGSVLTSVRSTMLAHPTGELATRLQQTSGMVMAKGIEDTTFYRYNRFVALNEVGGAPDRFGVSVEEFHARACARQAGRPTTMTTLSTHDTKRGEDTRARLAVLSEVPLEFAAAVTRWSRRCGLSEPTLNLLAWQSLVGTWPIEADRMRAYLLKAAREAKIATSWTDPDATFDAEVADWIDQVFDDADLRADLAAFVAEIELPGYSNSLGQKLTHLCSPGVPDVYQGTELWDFSLVDPDNRRPVDFAARAEAVRPVDEGPPPVLDASGHAKLRVVTRCLRLRRDRPELFTGYRPVTAEGPAAGHAVAFARSADLVAVATRLSIGLAGAGGWRDTVLALPSGTGSWTDVLTDSPVDGSVLRLAELLSTYPVALLVRTDG
jgi:(1->4)-alpha-D-glucan 1-alpha-D-glucosylmutase